MKADPIKTLYLLRHGHRDKPYGREFDNGLSPTGRKQAARIKKYFEIKLEDQGVEILSSPKIRCVETVQPLATALGVEVISSEFLTEQDEHEGETSEGLQRRVKQFCRQWRDGDAHCVIASSHGDWLPLCLKELIGADVELKKGAFARIQMKDGKVRLTWLVQNLKDFC